MDSQSSYSLPELAQMFNFSEKDVRRMLDRGEIIGRKVQGNWVFAAPDVHEWYEKWISRQTKDDALAGAEKIIAAQNFQDETAFSIADFLFSEAIEIPFSSRTKTSAISHMVSVAERTGYLWDGKKMTEAVRKREDVESTALPGGFAFLHPGHPIPSILQESFVAVGVSMNGIPFGGGFDNWTELFFLICARDYKTHLGILARLSRILNSPNAVELIKSADSSERVREILIELEGQLK